MEANSKFLDSANARVEAKIDLKTIEDRKQKLAQKATKDVKIDGFRKGKVPLNVVLERYGKNLLDQAKQEVITELINQELKNLKKEQSDILGEPIFSKYEEKDGNLDVSIDISFRPNVDISGYESCIPEYSTPRVTKKEIDTKVEEFLNIIAPIEKSDKKVLENGDFAKFDFEGFLDGKPFDGGKAKDYQLEIGSHQFIPGFEEAMVGLKVGEEKDLNLKFPQEYQAKDLAGKDVVFKVKLNEILEKKPAKELTDEVLKKALPNEKDITKEIFEERIKTQLKDEKLINLINGELKQKFADAVVEKITFDLPKNIVEQEIDMQFRSRWQQYKPEEMEKFRTDKDALTAEREKIRPEAEKSVKLTFIVDALAKEKNIQVTDQELIQTIYYEAYRYGINPKEHLKSYQEQGILPAMKMALIEEKLFNELFMPKSKKEAKDK